METSYIYIILVLLIAVGVLFFVLYFIMTKNKPQPELDYNNIIEKKTYTLFFNPDGVLQSTSTNNDQKNVLASLKIGQNINEYKKFNNIGKYFESCVKIKKNISIKLLEDREIESARRHDLIFSPLVENDIVKGVFIISQELILKNAADNTQSQQKELVEQRNYALKQIDEIEAQKSDLEQAFKKSSKHHIMLQKALRQIEIQKTDLEQALVTIKDQKSELEKANKEIRESSRLKEIFLANTSHEIRTPLNAIIGFTNLLLNSELNDGNRKYIENIKASGNNLLVVINDILDFSKIESGKLTLEEIEFNFENLIKHTLNTMQVKSQEKQIEIKYDISADIPQILIGDPVRLNQILINLVGNAVKFTNEKGQVRILATNGRADEGFVKILFKVIDNGIGIPRDKLDEIFQSFTQAESDTSRKYGGTGLGLSIVKQLIELQKGEISVESTLGKGTAFTFYVILKAGNPESLAHIKHQKGAINCAPADGMKILLVEDNIINQQLAYDTLKSWNKNLHIEIADNGKIAVDKVETTDYHLILMDIQMPEMDGNEATAYIRKMPAPKCEVPIMAMTAHALKNEKENSLRLGMDDYISKPFDPQELFIKVLKFSPGNLHKLNQSVDNALQIEPSNSATKTEIPVLYQYFHLTNLEKIYQENHEKIVKIVGMCYDSIPNEILEIQQAYNQQQWDILRNKAHSLKPKLGYLGMENIQENARKIEHASQQPDERTIIQELITGISKHWELAVPELKQFIQS